MTWKSKVLTHWNHTGVPSSKRHEALLRKGVSLLAKHRPQTSSGKRNPIGVDGQPFDHHLLALSPIYQKSRKLFIDMGGTYCRSLVSSARSLSSPILLTPRIEYSAIEPELIWRATLERPDPGVPLREICSFTTNLFHEQNHRLLWNLKPFSAGDSAALRRYLNFAESVVVGTDMALSDYLGPELSSLFYLTGAIYDPGTRVKLETPNRRAYRNYLQACIHATFLTLERYERKDIERVIAHLFSGLEIFKFRSSSYAVKRIVERCTRLDPAFVHQTNPRWQKRHHKLLMETLGSRKLKDHPTVPESPLDHRLQYLFIEKWFDYLGL